MSPENYDVYLLTRSIQDGFSRFLYYVGSSMGLASLGMSQKLDIAWLSFSTLKSQITM